MYVLWLIKHVCIGGNQTDCVLLYSQILLMTSGWLIKMMTQQFVITKIFNFIFILHILSIFTLGKNYLMPLFLGKKWEKRNDFNENIFVKFMT